MSPVAVLRLNKLITHTRRATSGINGYPAFAYR
jgi:hypothetical protein